MGGCSSSQPVRKWLTCTMLYSKVAHTEITVADRLEAFRAEQKVLSASTLGSLYYC
jgi:hypothetical protein